MTASPVARLIAGQIRARRGDLVLASICAAAAALAATVLLGLSGWFLAAAAGAGLAGPMSVAAFNYLLPSAGIRAMAITRTIGRYGERILGHRAALRSLAAIRPALFAGIAAAPPNAALALSSGEASARLVQDVDAVETAFVWRSAPWAAAAGAGAAAAAIAMASRPAGLIFLVGLAVQAFVAGRLSSRWTEPSAIVRLQRLGRLKDGLGAYIAAAPELRCFGLGSRAVEALMAHDAEVARAAHDRADAETKLDLVQTALAGVTLLAIGALVQNAPPPLVALALLSALAGQEGVLPLLRAWRDGPARREAVRRLDAVMGAVTSVAPPSPRPEAWLRFNGADISPGTRLALIAPSGGGKTTLIETLVGLRAAPAGLVAVDGAGLEDRPPGWARNLFALAPQDARLLTGTVAENLRLAAPTASDAELWAALKDGQLDARIRGMPRGLDTWLGDGGEILSGGERRRLSLARALLRPAPWLVLDEPTEGLDAATEAALIAALDHRLARTGQGLILAGHRPAPLRLCSQRLHLPGGVS